jgi:ClpP class serine protease
VEKSKDDINDILQLFKGFVKENRPSLDIEAVATGETWFGTDAMARGLCDEIKTADDVLLEYVDMNYNVYEVAYNPPIEVQSAFGNLLPSGSKAGRSDGIGNRLIKSLVSTVMSEVKEELSGGGTSARDRYMAKDPSNSSDNIRAQD